MDCTTFKAMWWVQRGRRLREFPEGTYYLVDFHPLYSSNNNARWRALEGKGMVKVTCREECREARNSCVPWSQKRLILTAGED